jgi:HEAT repeat protein
LAPNTLSDPFVAAAFWTGLGALALTILLSLQILRLRLALRRNERMEARALAKWRPVLHAAAVGEAPQLPVLGASERLPFIKLWVHLQGSLRGEAADALADVARRLGVDAAARPMLERGRRGERLLAALTLGHLRDRHAWDSLLRVAAQPDNALALTAMWALARIDARAAADYMVPRFIESGDWALSRVAGVLQEAAGASAEALQRLLPALPEARLPRALRIAEALRVALPSPVLDGALRSQNVDVLVCALRNAATPDALDAVRSLAAHPNWQVRVQAARALGRIGERADVDTLSALLGDREWWVRYRAAQALADLAALYGNTLEAVRASLSDRFAADMLAHVMAEKEIA